MRKTEDADLRSGKDKLGEGEKEEEEKLEDAGVEES